MFVKARHRQGVPVVFYLRGSSMTPYREQIEALYAERTLLDEELAELPVLVKATKRHRCLVQKSVQNREAWRQTALDTAHELEEVSERSSRLEDRVQQLQRQLEVMQKKIEALRAEISAARTANTALSDDKRLLEARLHSLETGRKQDQRRLESLEERNVRSYHSSAKAFSQRQIFLRPPCPPQEYERELVWLGDLAYKVDDIFRLKHKSKLSLSEVLVRQSRDRLDEAQLLALQQFTEELKLNDWEVDDVEWIQNRLKSLRNPRGHSSGQEKYTVDADRLRQASKKLVNPDVRRYARYLVTLVCNLAPDLLPLERVAFEQDAS